MAVAETALEERIAAFCQEVVAPAAAAMARGDGDGGRRLVAEAGRRGLAGLLVPTLYGGSGGSHLDFAHLIEAVARLCASSAVVLDVQASVAVEPIVGFGTETQRRRYLPRLASGEWVGAFALSEPASGSDAASLQARAERVEGGYVLRGTKMWISNCGIADLYVVMARTGGAGHRGVSAFLVEAGWPGVRPGRPLRKLGLRGSRTAELVLDGVEVPEANRLGDEGQGLRIALSVLDSGRIGISAQAVGIATGALEEALAHLRRRGPVDDGCGEAGLLDDSAASRLPSSHARCADMYARIAAARRLTWEAARRCDAGEPVTAAAAVAKLVSTDTAVAVAHEAVELCAPDSTDEWHGASVRLRDAKACQIYEGTNQIQRMVVARQLLKEYG